MARTAPKFDVDDLREEFAEAVLDGLAQDQKTIPCRFLYDARGSELFEQITGLDEYYPTRTEIALLERIGPELAELAGTGLAVVEFGSGSSRKTHILIDHLDDIAAYVPIDISDDALSDAAERLVQRHPDLTVLPVHGDFSSDIQLPKSVRLTPKLGFFPGSTIGNLNRTDALAFLKDTARLVGHHGALLIGVDLKKSLDLLLPAYNDENGVTAEFNLNLLHRINRELDGDIDVARFAHQAVYNAHAGRIEIYIVSLADQDITVCGQRIALAAGERIHTENSHKYSVEEFQALATEAGWQPAQVWTDPEQLFSIHYLRAE